ncbi:VOC family protein [Polyangium spumosum]|uniref:Glyoxalase/bleomycin resistance/extradiol dioxygenase family protein n=1 Tax=Polyangium spumosum TaxID=889282 RepID=A0A6N7Q1Y1_9BACT|nr:VOC family protein [Polyangium spumosum]MRG96264.1 glyoxalase/bleomycin resistance/extradiol dioxygenase family protein [Polyangium spumosum]
MTTTRSRMLFVNIAVKNLDRSVGFFTKLGFTFNQQFTDETATCMIVNEQACVMLLVESKFQGFTKKQICDTSTSNEAAICFSCESREEVDRMVEIALANGGSRAMPPQDHGFMYFASFYDIDGHHWEVMWMDPAAVQK